MNLAQLIDAESVQRGDFKESKPRRSSACAPLGTVTRQLDSHSIAAGGTPRAPALPPGHAEKRVREIVGAASGPVSAMEIFEATDELEIGQVQGALSKLYGKLEVERTGKPGSYRYTLPQPKPAAAGRAARTPGRHVQGDYSRAILEVLETTDEDLPVAEVIALLGDAAPKNVYGLIYGLVLQGAVLKIDGQRPYKFRITGAGRERLR